MRKITSLQKKLTAYSSIASAIIAGAKSADAQIIYTDIIPDYKFSSYVNDTFFIDLDNNGIFDYGIRSENGSCFGSWNVYGLDNNNVAYNDIYGDYQYAKGMDVGYLISENLNWDTGELLMNKQICTNLGSGPCSYCSTWGSFFENPGDDYFGFKFELQDGIHFGWARLGYSGLQDYAYQAIPDSSILAGAFDDCDTLQAKILSDKTCICTYNIGLNSNLNYLPFKIQWLKDNEIIPYATGFTYYAYSIGDYSYIATGANCIDTSDHFIVSYCPPPDVLPDITRELDTLYSNYLTESYWYLGDENNSNKILIATASKFVMDTSGYYSLKIKDEYGCEFWDEIPYQWVCSEYNGDAEEPFPKDTICFGDSIKMKIAAQWLYKSFQWYRDDSIIPEAIKYYYYAKQSGNYYSITVSNNDCINLSDSLSLIVVPEQPVITLVNDSMLVSTEAESYQWYLNSLVINGATNKEYIPSEFGVYQVETTFNSCKAMSEPFTYSPLNSGETFNSSDFNFYLINKTLFIKSTFPFQISIYNDLGLKVTQFEIDKFESSINVSLLASGIYFLYAENNDKRIFKKFVIE